MTAPTTTAPIRQLPGYTLASLREELGGGRTDVHTEDVGLSDFELHLDANPAVFTVGRDELPATETGIGALGDFLQVPAPFLRRFHREVGVEGVQDMLGRLLRTTKARGMRVTYGPGGVVAVRDIGRMIIEPVQVVDVAARVTRAPEAEVTRLVRESGEFSFDVRVPEDHGFGVGGDREVGDITAGGLRFRVDTKRALAPSVGTYLYRLVCTNGMSQQDPGLRLDARGQTVEEVLADLEAVAERAFSRVERQIEAFYNLRWERVDNPERVLRAIARERGIPDRSLVRLVDLAVSDRLPDEPSMFDVVNLVTNLANDPAVRNDGGRRLLEDAGGALIADHSARCGHCQQALRS